MATKDYSSIQENLIADSLGWRVVSGSGAARCCPGDVIGDDWLGECKTHISPGHKIYFNYKVWQKICTEAMFDRRYPVLFTDDGSQKCNKTWCLLQTQNLYSDEIKHCDISNNSLSNINISVSHNALLDLVEQHKVDEADQYISLDLIWHGENVSILQLETFIELFRE